jgi:TPR repeat protein
MYDHGIGLHQNIETAISWYLKSSRQGHKQSKINLRCLEKTIPNYNQIIEKYIEPKNEVRVTQRVKSAVDCVKKTFDFKVCRVKAEEGSSKS